MIYASGVLAVLVIICAARTLFFRMRRTSLSADTFSADGMDPEDLKRFRKLIRIRTVSHKDASRRDEAEFRKFPKYIKDEYPGIIKHLEFHQEGLYGCYLIWQGTDGSLKPGVFMAHFDVIGVENQHWTMEPFGGDMFDGCIWGRGTLDTKNTVSGILCAVDALLKEGYAPERTLYFVFGGDEELMGELGTGRMCEIFREKGMFFDFVLDEGSIVADGMVPGIKGKTALIGIGEKGFANFCIKTHGAGGHAAYPPRVTAGGRLARALYRLEKKKSPLRTTLELKKFLEGAAPYVPLASAVLFSNLWLFAPLITLILSLSPKSAALVRTTRSITIIRGGDADNVLPQNTEAVINCRLLPGDTVIRALERCKRVIRDPEVEIMVDKNGGAGDPRSAGSLKRYGILSEVIRNVFPDAVIAPNLVTASTDSKYFADISAEIYRFVPMVLTEEEVDRIHGSDERISVENFYRGIVFFKEAVRRLS